MATFVHQRVQAVIGAIAVAALGSRLDDALGILDRAGSGTPQAFPLALVEPHDVADDVPRHLGRARAHRCRPRRPRARLVAPDADAAAALAQPADDDLRRRLAQPRPLRPRGLRTEGCKATEMSIPRLPVPWRTPVATAQPNLVEVAHFTDAACPWAYNFEPTLRALEARYGDQLHVRTVMIGLSESHEDYVARGYSAEGTSLSRRRFRRRGMPMATFPRPRPLGTGPACRLVKAAERQGVPQAEAVLRALRFGWFTTDLVMDEPETLRAVAESVDGLDAERAIADAGTRRGRGGLPARPRRGALARSASPSSSAAPRRPTGPIVTPRRASSCVPTGASSSRPATSPSRPSTCS